MENKDCWLKDNCNRRDCNTFCMRLFKLDYLYKEALMPLNQRRPLKLRLDASMVDENAFVKLKEIQDNICQFVEEGNSVYIHSSIAGNGKTSWAIRLMQTFFNKIWPKTKLECRGLFINVPRFLLSLKDNIETKSEYVEHIKRNVLDCDLVIWDEVGSKGLTQFEHEHLLSLINARIDSGKANIYTSNLTSEELHKVVGDRLHSRIVNRSVNIEFFGLDKRGIL